MSLKQTKRSTKKLISPFAVEEYRNDLAEKHDIKLFKTTYTSLYPQLKNINTGGFWDKIFASNPTYKDQDMMTKEKIDTVISFLPPKRSIILDLGIGQGYLEERLSEKKLDYKIYGIDISPISIKKSKSMFNGKFKLGDVLDMDKHYKSNFFDAIVALELIEHIPPSKIFSFYTKVRKLLKKNGTFIITTPLNEGLENMKENPSGHVREYAIPILKTELTIAGFAVKKIKTFYAFKTMYRFKKLLTKLNKKRWKPNNVAILCVKS